MTTLLDLLPKGAIVTSNRLKRSERTIIEQEVSNTIGDVTVWSAHARSPKSENDGYDVTLKLHHGSKAKIELRCSCGDWFNSGGSRMQDGEKNTRPCKHILALANKATLPSYVALDTSVLIPVSSIAAKTVSTMPVNPTPTQPFQNLISEQIDAATNVLAIMIERILLYGGVPLIVGATGSGKTTATRKVALRQGWRLVEAAGAPSYSDADLVGIVHVNGTPFPGPIADAFSLARLMSLKSLLFFDEVTRFNARALEALMRPTLPIAAEAAQLMGIETDVPVRVTSAPFWGTEWAPAEKVPMVLACNPWGNSIDPALVRRTTPVFVNFSEAVADAFDKPIATAIKATWRAVDEGRWPLPIEYQALARAEGPDDKRIFNAYQDKLRVLDPAAAEGFAATLKSIGI